MTIKIHTRKGILTVECEPTDKISDIKSKIAVLNSIPVDKQKLEYNGAVLENESTLQDYSIQHDYELDLTEIRDSIVTLGDLSALYDGDMLFSAREIVEGTNEEKILISFKAGEQDFVKSEVTKREVLKFRAEVSEKKIDITKHETHVIMAVILGDLVEKACELPSNEPSNEPTQGNEPNNDPGNNSDPTSSNTSDPSANNTNDPSSNNSDPSNTGNEP